MRMNKKKVIILVVALVIIIIIGIILTMYFMNRAKYVFDVKNVSEIKYNVLNIDDRYGVIDDQGNIIIEPSYNVIQIPDPSIPVFICMSNYSTETKEYETKVLNDKKEQIITGYDNVQAIPTETTADEVPFENTVLRYKQDGKYGLIDMEGNEITDAIYDEITAMTYKEGMLLVREGDYVGIININGVEVIKPEYYSITVDKYYDVDTKYQKTGFIVCKVEENGYRYGYINYKGDKVLDTEYTQLERVSEIEDNDNIYLIAYKDGQAGLLRNRKVILNHEYENIIYNAYNNVFVIQRNGRQGVADNDGNIKIEPQYTNITFGGIYINATTENNDEIVLDLNGTEVNDGYISKTPTSDGNHFIVYGEDGIYKIIDNNGNVVIDRNYTNIEEIGNNYYIVATDRNNGIIDLSGKSLVDLKYNSIVELDNTELLQANISETSTVSLINKSMQIVVTMDDANIDVKDNYIRLYSETENRYFDYSGNELSASQVFPANQLYAKKINDTWGFVDKDGNLKVQNQYEMVTEFNEYGFAGIKVDGKWGVINEEGTIVQEPIYELESVSPTFIGKYYKANEWYGNSYFTDKVAEQQ